MDKESIIKLAQKAKEVGCVIYGAAAEKAFRYVSICEIDGTFTCHFEYYSRGNTDYYSIEISDEQMEQPIEETIKQHKEYLSQLEARKLLEKQESQRLYELDQEKKERAEFERLKNKFKH